MLVERVDAHLTWRRVLTSGALSGAWLGLFVGLLMSLFTSGSRILPIMLGLLFGVVFGLTSAAVRYASARGQRNFLSHSQLVARRYDVLSQPPTAERARDLARGTRPTRQLIVHFRHTRSTRRRAPTWAQPHLRRPTPRNSPPSG